MKRGFTVLVALAGAAQAACMTGPQRVKYSTTDYLEANAPSRVWATLSDGEQVVIYGPKVISDTVFGFVDGEEAEYPAGDLQEIRVQHVSVIRSAILPVALAGGVTAAFLTKHSASALPPEDNSQTNTCKYDQTAPGCAP